MQHEVRWSVMLAGGAAPVIVGIVKQPFPVEGLYLTGLIALAGILFLAVGARPAQGVPAAPGPGGATAPQA